VGANFSHHSFMRGIVPEQMNQLVMPEKRSI
jgi:hypothetical protein